MTSDAIPGPLAGRIIITWPSKAWFADSVPIAGVLIVNADTGEPIVTVTDLAIHMGLNTSRKAVAELTTTADLDGNPIIGMPQRGEKSEFYDDDGNCLLATSRWAVVEMRVAS